MVSLEEEDMDAEQGVNAEQEPRAQFAPLLLRNCTRGQPLPSLGAKQQAVPELMERMVYFSVHPPRHNHIEQQAAIFICWLEGVCLSRRASGLVKDTPSVGCGSPAIWLLFTGPFSRRLAET